MLQIQLSLNFEIQSMILDNDETQTRLLTTIIKPLTLMFVLRNPISTIYISAKHGAKAAIKSSLNSILFLSGKVSTQPIPEKNSLPLVTLKYTGLSVFIT